MFIHEEFVDLYNCKIFKENYFYKIYLLCIARLQTSQADVLDILLYSHGLYYKIETARKISDNKLVTKLIMTNDVDTLRLPGCAFSVDDEELLSLKYFYPDDKEQIFLLDCISEDILNNNTIATKKTLLHTTFQDSIHTKYFSILRNDEKGFNLYNLKGLNKGSNMDFLNKHFADNKFLLTKTKQNDDFTKSCRDRRS